MAFIHYYASKDYKKITRPTKKVGFLLIFFRVFRTTGLGTRRAKWLVVVLKKSIFVVDKKKYIFCLFKKKKKEKKSFSIECNDMRIVRVVLKKH